MAELKYNGNTVNSVVSQITNIAGKFDPLANTVKTSTGLMIGRKGFEIINPGLAPESICQAVGTCSEALGALVKEIRTKQVAILTYSQDKDEINAFVDSLSRLEYDSLDLSGIDSKISTWKKLSFAAKGIFASVGTFAAGFVEGAANFVETAVDTAAVVATGAASIFTKPYDLIVGTNITDEMWDSTKAYVAEEQVASIADQFYANTEAGQWLKENSYGFDTVRGIGKGVGYSTTMILAGNVFAGAGGVDATVKAARLAKALPAMSGVLGFGNASEEGWGNGATTEKGLTYGVAGGAWEAVQWGAGVKISSLGSHIDDIAKVGAKQVFKDASKRVMFDTVDSALEGFAQPTLTMIYRKYDGETFGQQWANAFETNGGWNGVLQQAVIGGVMSGASEAGDVFKYTKQVAKSKKSGGGSGEGNKTTTPPGGSKSEEVFRKEGGGEQEARVETQENSNPAVVENGESNKAVVEQQATDPKAKKLAEQQAADTNAKKPVEQQATDKNANKSPMQKKPADPAPKQPVAASPAKTTPKNNGGGKGAGVETHAAAVAPASQNVRVETQSNVDPNAKVNSPVTQVAPIKPAVETNARVNNQATQNTSVKPAVDTNASVANPVTQTAPIKPVVETNARVNSQTTQNASVKPATEGGANATINSSTPARLGSDNPANLAAGLSSMVGDGKISGGDVSKAGVGVATMAGLGKLGTGMRASSMDADFNVDVKLKGETEIASARTSRQLSGDLEKMSKSLPTKQAKVEAAQTKLNNYRTEAGDAADPKVIKKLEGEVNKAQADYDKQLSRVKEKAEQRNAVATQEIDEKLASGSTKGLVGTERGKLVDGEFTTESATAKGEISKKEFATETATRESLMRNEETVEVKATDTVSDDINAKYGITDNEDYDSIMAKMDKAVEDGKISRQDADSLIERVAEEQHFDEKAEIARLREENAGYEKDRQANIERKELLVTQDGAKAENVKGYDEAVRQIDDQIKANNDKIAELEANIKEKPVEVQPETVVKPAETQSEDINTKYGITDNEDYDSIMAKMDKAVEEGRISREDADSLIERVAEEQHFDEKAEIARLREENAGYEKDRQANIERKELLVTQDGAKAENVKGYDEAVRQIDDQIKANNDKIAELEASIKDKPETVVKPDEVQPEAVVKPDEVQSETVIKSEPDSEAVVRTDAEQAVKPENEVQAEAVVRPENDVNTRTDVEDINSKYGITDNEDYDSIMAKMDKAVVDGKISRQDADSLIERVAEEQHFDAKAEVSRLREENAAYERDRQANIDRKGLLVTQDGAKAENVKGYDEAVRQIDEQIKTNNTKIAELEKEINTPITRLGVDNTETKLTTDTLINNSDIEPEVVALGNAAAAVTTIGRLGTDVVAKGGDVTVKSTNTETSTRTSKQLGADLEKLSTGLSDKQAKLDTAKANLDKYKAEMGDAADPKVVKKLEGEVSKAQSEYDKQLVKVKDKAELRNTTAAREIDEKLASGSTKGLVGTEKGKIVDGEFTTESATAKGEISKKEFATETATRESLMRNEEAVEVKATDTVSDEVKAKFGITENENYDSLINKLEKAVESGELTKEAADDIFYKIAEEQHFDANDRIDALRAENAAYARDRQANIERKELLVTQDGAKAESVKGYDEAVRQIDERINSNNEEISRINQETGAVGSDSSTKVEGESNLDVIDTESLDAKFDRLSDEITSDINRTYGENAEVVRTEPEIKPEDSKVVTTATQESEVKDVPLSPAQQRAKEAELALEAKKKQLETELAAEAKAEEVQLEKLRTESEQRLQEAHDADQRKLAEMEKDLEDTIRTENERIAQEEAAKNNGSVISPDKNYTMKKANEGAVQAEKKVAETTSLNYKKMSEALDKARQSSNGEVVVIDGVTYKAADVEAQIAALKNGDNSPAITPSREYAMKKANEGAVRAEKKVAETTSSNYKKMSEALDKARQSSNGEVVIDGKTYKASEITPDTMTAKREATSRVERDLAYVRKKADEGAVRAEKKGAETTSLNYKEMSEALDRARQSSNGEVVIDGVTYKAADVEAQIAALKNGDNSPAVTPSREYAMKKADEGSVQAEKKGAETTSSNYKKMSEALDRARQSSNGEVVIDGVTYKATDVEAQIAALKNGDNSPAVTPSREYAMKKANEGAVRAEKKGTETTSSNYKKMSDALDNARQSIRADEEVVINGVTYKAADVVAQIAALKNGDNSPVVAPSREYAMKKANDPTTKGGKVSEYLDRQKSEVRSGVEAHKKEVDAVVKEVKTRADDETDTRLSADEQRIDKKRQEADRRKAEMTAKQEANREKMKTEVEQAQAESAKRIREQQVAADKKITEMESEVKVRKEVDAQEEARFAKEQERLKAEINRVETAEVLAPVSYSDRMKLADDLCANLGDDYAVGMHGIGMRSGDQDPNVVMNSIAQNGLEVRNNRTVHGTVEFFGRPGSNRADVTRNIDNYAYGGGNQVIIATPTTIKNANGEMIYIGGPNTKSSIVDYSRGGYDTTSLGDKCLVVDGKVPSEFVYGYFTDNPDGSVEFHPNPNHVSKTGGVVTDATFNHSKETLSREFNSDLTKLLSSKPSEAMLPEAMKVYEGLQKKLENPSFFNDPADIKRDMETVLQYQNDCKGKVDAPTAEVKNDAIVKPEETVVRTEEDTTVKPVETRVENGREEAVVRTEEDTTVKPVETRVENGREEAVVRTEEDTTVKPVETRVESDDARVKTDEQLARLTKEHDAEVDRIKQKQEQDIDAARRDKNRQLMDEEARYNDEVARLKKQHARHEDDLSLYRGENATGVKATERQLKQKYEGLYEERLYNLKQQHQSRMADIESRGNATIRNIESRYSEDIRVVDKMLQDVKTDVANGNLTGQALGAKKLISDYDNFVRRQNEYDADRRAIIDRYNAQKADAEHVYRGDMNSLENFNEQARNVVRRGEMEPTYYLERAGLDGICDRNGLKKLEVFFDEESVFVRRLYEGDSEFVLRNKNNRIAELDARMNQELRDLETRYRESGMDVTDQYKKYEMAIQSDDLSPDALKALDKQLEMDELLADFTDDSVAVERIQSLRKGIEEKIGVQTDSSVRVTPQETPSTPVEVRHESGTGTNEAATVNSDATRTVNEPVITGSTRRDGSSVMKQVYPDGRVVDSEYNYKGDLVSQKTTEKSGAYSIYKEEIDGRKITSNYDKDGNLIRSETVHKNGFIDKKIKSDVEGKYDYIKMKSNGDMIEIKYTSPNGDDVHVRFNSDGSSYGHAVGLDGTVKDMEYDSNNNLIRHFERRPDGSVYDTKYKNNVITDQKVSKPDGSSIVYSRTSDGASTTTYDASGYPIKVESIDALGNRTTTNQHPNGNYSKQTVDNTGRLVEEVNRVDNVVTHTTVNDDGTKLVHVKDPKGYESKVLYSQDNIPINAFENKVDGTFVNKRFDGDGNLIETISTAKSGTVTVETRHTDGSTTTKVTASDNSLVETVMKDKNGKVTREVSEYQNGTKYEKVINPDGSSSVKVSNPDKTYDIRKLDSNGNLIERKWTTIDGTTRTQTPLPDGTAKRHTVDGTNGNVRDSILRGSTLLEQVETRPDRSMQLYKLGSDGSRTITEISPDGTTTTYVKNLDGTYDRRTVDKYNNFLSREYKDRDGTLRFEKANRDGTYSRHTTKRDGTVSDTVFTRNGDILHRIENRPDKSRIITERTADGGKVITEISKDGVSVRHVYDKYGNEVRPQPNVRQQPQQTGQKQSIFDRFRRQQPQVQQQMPTFRNAGEVIRGVSNPLNETNLQKIARKINEDILGDPYNKIVSLNTKEPKIIPSLQSAKEFHDRFGLDRSLGKRYINDKGYRIVHQGPYFDHVRSANFDSGVTDRLYLNIADYNQSYKFCELFATECEKRGIPFYFKTAASVDGKIHPMQKMRDESIVIYSGRDHLSDYTNIASEIISKYGFKLEEPPILSGKLKNNIGYGAEPDPNIVGYGEYSFNSLRSEIIGKAVFNLNLDYQRRGLKIDTDSYYRDLRDLITKYGKECGIDINNFCKNIE